MCLYRTSELNDGNDSNDDDDDNIDSDEIILFIVFAKI